jgi:hypothetical protein
VATAGDEHHFAAALLADLVESQLQWHPARSSGRAHRPPTQLRLCGGMDIAVGETGQGIAATARASSS